MDKALFGKMDAVHSLAQEDPIYQHMLRDMSAIEREYFLVLRSLSADQQNVICDFVSQCEEMSYRMLEIACSLIRFSSNLEDDSSLT